MKRDTKDGRQINLVNVGVTGAGRMGLAVAASVEDSPDLCLVGVWKRGGDLGQIIGAADVIIDFSLPEGTEAVLAEVVREKTPLVCGVSGLTVSQTANLEQAAKDVPIVYDRNMSLGIAVLERVVREAAAALGPDFAVKIAETHHVHKKDAPSGTALMLGEAIASARGELGTDAISFESRRIGEVPGDHDVTLHSATEQLTFAHSVTTRQVFADGALRAARWVVEQPPGCYSMGDVLFGK